MDYELVIDIKFLIQISIIFLKLYFENKPSQYKTNRANSHKNRPKIPILDHAIAPKKSINQKEFIGGMSDRLQATRCQPRLFSFQSHRPREMFTLTCYYN